MDYVQKPTSCKQLLEEYVQRKSPIKTEKLKFNGVSGYDVYNISGEFEDNGKIYIAGRVEKRESEIACIRFFVKKNEYEYDLVNDIEITHVQDPFVSRIDGDLIVGGTQIDLDPLTNARIVNWRTVFFRGKDLFNLKYWFTSPCRMKDVRIFDYDENRMLLLSRPQGGNAKMGKIGMTFINKNEYPTEKTIIDAPLFDCHFLDNEWGGANEIFRLKNGLIGVLGHIAYMDLTEDQCIRHYHSMVFALDAEKGKCSKIKIIARRSDFQEGPCKREDIKDVLFSGGLIRENDGTARLFTGVSDCEGHVAVIEDPFIEFEEV